MVDNAFLFVVDALRWDYLPDSVADCGHVRKTVAASTISPTAFASIFSGLHPPQHGVYTFYHQLSREHTLLSLDGVNTSFWQILDDGKLYDVLGQDPATKAHLEDIEPPFIHVERELNTHEPYNQWNNDYLDARQQGNTTRYNTGNKGQWETVRDDYAAGAQTAAQRLQDRLETLDDRGLLDETLVIVTADHGELLGEYGEWSHTDPLVPELVYVPTVVIHPEGRSPGAQLIRHVDLLRTVADCCGVDVPWEMVGGDIFQPTNQRYGYTEYRKPLGGGVTTQDAPIHRHYQQIHRGVFGNDWGWAFNDSLTRDKILQLPMLAYRLLDPRRPRDIPKAPSGFYHHWARQRRFGDPSLPSTEARQYIEDINNRPGPRRGTAGLDDEQVAQLRDLGYV